MHAPLNQAGIIISPRAHYLEHPPRIIGFESVLDTRASCQSDGKTRVALTIGYGYYSVLVRRTRSHDTPIEPAWFPATRASFNVALSR